MVKIGVPDGEGGVEVVAEIPNDREAIFAAIMASRPTGEAQPESPDHDCCWRPGGCDPDVCWAAPVGHQHCWHSPDPESGCTRDVCCICELVREESE